LWLKGEEETRQWYNYSVLEEKERKKEKRKKEKRNKENHRDGVKMP
jgi:hypothetical protein